jgi:N-ethylmaleimide reductase
VKLLDPFALGDLELPNRVVMAPMTRNRAAGTVPPRTAAPYYAARASAGLIVSEAVQVSPRGQGYADTPGLYTGAQREAWKLVTDAVHDRGGRIFVQLYHVGRLTHSDYHGFVPVAPSPSAPAGFVRTPKGLREYETPHELSTAEVADVVDEFARAASLALEAGFDGVELHGGQGFLIDQFVQSGTNRRTDRYGGTLENRVRFALEVLEAVSSVWDRERVAFAVSPGGNHKGIRDEDPIGTFTYLARRLSEAGLGLLHVMEQPIGEVSPTALLREAFSGPLLSSEGYTMETAEEAVVSGRADLIAFGRAYTANPDLVERFRDGRELEYHDPATFYAGGERGYIDNLSPEFVERYAGQGGAAPGR